MAKTKTTLGNSIILNNWKSEMFDILQSQTPRKLSRKKVYQKLDNIILEVIKNPNLTVINNYTNRSVRTDLLSLIDLIEENKLIVCSGATLFRQHGVGEPNILLEFILDIMNRRSFWKKERKKYDERSYEYAYADLMQLLYKLIINSLYGCLGYPGFVLYNIFIAETVTSQGKHTIATAIECFENFLGNHVMFDTKGEVFTFINNVSKDFHSKYKETISISEFRVNNVLGGVVRKIIEKCTFPMTQDFIDVVTDTLRYRSEEELTVLYYKNSLMEFLKTPYMTKLFKSIIDLNGQLDLPEPNAIKNDEARLIALDMWNLIDTYVFYEYPIFDRLRKALYTDKSRSLYTDTDSVFISLDEAVRYCRNDVMHGEYDMSDDDMSVTAVNIVMIFVNFAIDRALKRFATSCNVTEKWTNELVMKNELIMKLIVFVDRKKRYIALKLRQEGQVLGGGKGIEEIKGFEFKKATTKEYLRDFYTEISLNDILYPEEINPREIFAKINNLRSAIERGVREGDRKYFKQASVKILESYKNPFQLQGVTSVLFWNALCPDALLDFPVDVNIVPVIDLRFYEKASKKKPLDFPNIAKFASEYPEYFERLDQAIYSNMNPEIRHMGMSYIAIPKNTEVEIPECIYNIIDYDKIVTDAVALFLPILNSIGIKSLSVSSNVDILTNFVDL